MKQEVRRGRKFVEYHDPDTQDAHTFTQEISGADVSYQDEGGLWHQLVEDWETDGQNGFSFRASRMNHKVRFGSIGAWRWYPRRNVETEYLILNRPECWLTATKRWGNLLVNGISREGKDITLTSVRKVTRVIHSRWNGIKTDWIIEDASAPTRFRQKIDLVGITEIDGVLFGADGERLASLMPTTATDANGAELACTGSYSGGYVEFQADVTGAVFPVTIDPDFASSNDGRIYHEGTNTDYSIARTLNPTYSSINSTTSIVGQILSSGRYRFYRAFLKFDTSAIGADSTVTQVNLKLVATADATTDDVDVVIVKQDWSEWSGDSSNTTKRNAAYFASMTADADDSIWRNTSGMSTNTQYTSGNLSTSWVSKTGTTYYSIVTKPDRDATAPDNNEYITIAISGNATESYRPVLSVTYTTGGALRRINMSSFQQLNGGANG